MSCSFLTVGLYHMFTIAKPALTRCKMCVCFKCLFFPCPTFSTRCIFLSAKVLSVWRTRLRFSHSRQGRLWGVHSRPAANLRSTVYGLVSASCVDVPLHATFRRCVCPFRSCKLCLPATRDAPLFPLPMLETQMSDHVLKAANATSLNTY